MKLLSINLMLISLLAVSCKSSEKSGEQSYEIESAIWYNWAGGIAGVGGTNYEIIVSLPKAQTAEATSLTIDGSKMKIEKSVLADGKLTVTSINNTSANSQNMSVQQQDPVEQTPKFRKENPKQASITINVDGKEINMVIEKFEKQSPKNYQ